MPKRRKRFGCPTCGDTHLILVRAVIVANRVDAWEEDGTPIPFGKMDLAENWGIKADDPGLPENALYCSACRTFFETAIEITPEVETLRQLRG